MAPLAVIAAMLIVFFSLSAAASTKAKTANPSDQKAKSTVARAEYNSWAMLNRQFAWNTAGRMVPRSGSNEGC